MLRILGTFLLMAPLLVPQGMCVCAVVPPKRVPRSTTAVELPAESHCCRQCRKHPATVTPTRCSTDAPLEAPPRHAPNCPAESQWQAQPVQILTLLAPAVAAPLLAGVPVGPCAWTPAAAAPAPEQPLYLTLLTLLI